VSNLENRVKKLEQRPEADKPRATIVYVKGNSEAETEAARKKAIAEYKSKHPDWEPSSEDWYIQVLDAETKELTERIITGELPGEGGEHDARAAD
jgi:hypothetical protein